MVPPYERSSRYTTARPRMSETQSGVGAERERVAARRATRAPRAPTSRGSARAGSTSRRAARSGAGSNGAGGTAVEVGSEFDFGVAVGVAVAVGPFDSAPAPLALRSG